MLRQIAMHTAPVSYEFGLLNAVHNLTETINRRGEAHVQFIPVAQELKLSKSLEITVYRIIQEMLLNFIKHAFATEIVLQLIGDANHLSITYEDNGKGFDYRKELKKKNAIGLKKIKQRVELFNGKIQFDSIENRGTIITIDLKID
jgi:signal transduction histidine kinase